MQVLISEARVMGLGPKFMSVYVQKLAVRNPFVLFSILVQLDATHRDD